MAKVLYDFDYAIVTYFKNYKLLQLEWKKPGTKEEYENIFLKASELPSSLNIQYFLSDIRKAGVVTIETLKWLKEDIIPIADKLGITKVGLLLRKDLFSKIYANSIQAGLEGYRIAFNYFNHRDEAISWFQF